MTYKVKTEVKRVYEIKNEVSKYITNLSFKGFKHLEDNPFVENPSSFIKGNDQIDILFQIQEKVLKLQLILVMKKHIKT